MSGKPGKSGGRRKGAGRKPSAGSRRAVRQFSLSLAAAEITDALPLGAKSQFVSLAIQMHARFGRHFPC